MPNNFILNVLHHFVGHLPSKRHRAKRTRLQDSGPLTGKKASELLVEKGVVEQEGRDELQVSDEVVEYVTYIRPTRIVLDLGLIDCIYLERSTRYLYYIVGSRQNSVLRQHFPV